MILHELCQQCTSLLAEFTSIAIDHLFASENACSERRSDQLDENPRLKTSFCDQLMVSGPADEALMQPPPQLLTTSFTGPEKEGEEASSA